MQINSEAEGKSNRKETVFSELDKAEPGDHQGEKGKEKTDVSVISCCVITLKLSGLQQ